MAATNHWPSDNAHRASSSNAVVTHHEKATTCCKSSAPRVEWRVWHLCTWLVYIPLPACSVKPVPTILLQPASPRSRL